MPGELPPVSGSICDRFSSMARFTMSPSACLRVHFSQHCESRLDEEAGCCSPTSDRSRSKRGLPSWMRCCLKSWLPDLFDVKISERRKVKLRQLPATAGNFHCFPALLAGSKKDSFYLSFWFFWQADQHMICNPRRPNGLNC